VDQDLMDLDGLQRILGRATVIYAFLLPHLIREIEPVLLQAVADGKRVVLYCSTGSRVRRLDALSRAAAGKAGNALGELVPSLESCFGRLRCYGQRAPSTSVLHPSAPTPVVAKPAPLSRLRDQQHHRSASRLPTLPSLAAQPAALPPPPLPIPPLQPLLMEHPSLLAPVILPTRGLIRALPSGLASSCLPALGTSSHPGWSNQPRLLRVGSKSRLAAAPRKVPHALPALAPPPG
jgi:hypothetical protein